MLFKAVLVLSIILKVVMSYDNVAIVSRAGWGARPTKSATIMPTPVSFVFVHHTAMATCCNINDCSKEMRNIQNFHMDNRTWDDIGYNFLIGEDGKVYEGRGWDRVGAHTYGWNDISVAFSIMGNFNERLPNELALNALKNVIELGIRLRKITHNYKMYGHRNVRSTECPGNELYDLIKNWPNFGPLPPVKPTKHAK